MGFGGIIASALAGGVAGAAGSMAESLLEEQKNEAQRLRDEALASLAQKTYAANKQTDIANIVPTAEATAKGMGITTPVEAARAGQITKATEDARVAADLAKPVAVPAGSALVKPGTGETIVEARAPQLAPEVASFYKQNEKFLRAQTDALLSGAKEKPNGPKLIEKEIGPPGNTTAVIYDQNSGAYGVWVPGKPAVPEKSQWFGLARPIPGQPAVDAHIEWRGPDGRPLPGGIDDLYKDAASARSKRTDGVATPKTSGPSQSPAESGPQSSRIPPEVQRERDDKRLQILSDELEAETDPANRAAIQADMANIRRKMGADKPAAPAQVRAAAGVAAATTPPPAAVEYLQSHPESAADFDLKYGPGSARRAMKGSRSAAGSIGGIVNSGSQ